MSYNTAPSSSSAGTVPPPSRPGSQAQTRSPEHRLASYGSTSSNSSSSSVPRRTLHRPSIMSLSAGSSGSSAPFSGSSLPSPRALRRRSRIPATEGESDNWTSLRDMVSEDEGEGEGSDTDTIRAASPAHYGSRSGFDAQTPRKSTSIASVRSFFTAKSNLTSERSLSIPRSQEGGRPVASALLSSSPPQMNGFSNGIEEMLDEGNDHRHGRPEDSEGMKTNDKLPSLLRYWMKGSLCWAASVIRRNQQARVSCPFPCTHWAWEPADKQVVRHGCPGLHTLLLSLYSNAQSPTSLLHYSPSSPSSLRSYPSSQRPTPMVG
jgi:hypothetical protein